MRIPGKHVRRLRWIQADRYAIAVDIEMVIPDDDPSEPCLESESVELLREVQERSRGDVDWLRQHAKVYEAIDAA